QKFSSPREPAFRPLPTPRAAASSDQSLGLEPDRPKTSRPWEARHFPALPASPHTPQLSPDRPSHPATNLQFPPAVPARESALAAALSKHMWRHLLRWFAFRSLPWKS